MERNQKITSVICLFSLAFLAPLLTVFIFQMSMPIMKNAMNIGPHDVHMATLYFVSATSILISLLIRPAFLKTFVNSSFRSSVKLAINWTIIGFLASIVLAFFGAYTEAMDVLFLACSSAVFAFGVAAIGFYRKMFAGGDAIGFGVAAAVVFWVMLSPLGQSGMTGQALDLISLKSFQNSPLTIIILFVFSAVIAFYIGRRYFGGVSSATGRAVRAVFVVSTFHVIWIAFATLAGAAHLLPRWLPVISALIMLSPRVISVLLGVLRGQGLFGAGGLLMSRARVGASDTLADVTNGRLNSSSKKAWIVSFTGVSNEPRVLRQAEALQSAGWDVIVCGFDGHSQRPANWTFIRLPNGEPFKSSVHSAAQMIRGLIPNLIRQHPTGTFGAALARISHSTNLWWKHIELELCRIARERPDLKANLVIAHDYHTAPAGYALSKIFKAKFSIDVHEYAREQYSNDPAWVRDQQPVIIGVQDYYLRRADVVTVVCQGIADLIAHETKLKSEPVVVRNVPFLQSMPLKMPDEVIKVLYHGDLSLPRQIHVLIESVPLWRPEFRLLLRGSGDPTYVGQLKRRISSLGIEGRVVFEPPVPFKDIVRAANSADIGILSYESYSPQIQFCLPNKIFEYIQAGLALCVSNLDEIGRIVRGYKVGKLIDSHDPRSIAEAINGFTAEDLIMYKRASLAAAKELNWDLERERLISAYSAIT